MASSSFQKRRERNPSFLRVKASMVLLRASLIRSLSTQPFPYGTPSIPLVYFFLRCLIVRPFRPLMLGYSLARQVSLVPLKLQTLKKFLIFRSGKDFERRCLSSLISSLGKSKVGPSGWIGNSLMRSSWVT